MIERWIFKKLSTTSAVTALIGSDPTRVYPIVANQDTPYPFVTYRRQSTEYDDDLDAAPATEDAVNVEVTAWGETHGEARNLAAKIQAALAGAVGRETIDGDNLIVHRCAPTNAADEPVFFPDGKDVPRFGFTTTFEIQYQET